MGSDGWEIRREQGEVSLRYFLPPLTTPGSLLGVTTQAGTSSVVTTAGQLGRSCTCWPSHLTGGWSWLYGHRLRKTVKDAIRLGPLLSHRQGLTVAGRA